MFDTNEVQFSEQLDNTMVQAIISTYVKPCD